MSFSNLGLSGSSYWWRKKKTVADLRLTLAFPIGAMRLKDARVIALRLGSAAEALRTGYGERSSGISPDQLKKVFSDVLRWRLQRILNDQAVSSTAAVDHASVNSHFVEAWTFLLKHAVEAKWSLDDLDRLIANGWEPLRNQGHRQYGLRPSERKPVWGEQISADVDSFGIAPTATSLDNQEVFEIRRVGKAMKEHRPYAGVRPAPEPRIDPRHAPSTAGRSRQPAHCPPSTRSHPRKAGRRHRCAPVSMAAREDAPRSVSVDRSSGFVGAPCGFFASLARNIRANGIPR